MNINFTYKLLTEYSSKQQSVKLLD